jgi:hypothetical protein
VTKLSMMPVWGAAIVLVDLGLLALAATRPLVALRALLILLPLHSGVYLLARNVFLVDSNLLSLGVAWKEAIIAGLVILSLRRWFVLRGRPDLLNAVALLLLLAIALHAVADVASGSSPVDVAFGARQLAEWIVLFLAVRSLRPPVDWFLVTARFATPIVAFVALFGIIQPPLGAAFYDHFFHAPGELLHSAYQAVTGDATRFRAVGTFVAPNEFGLGMVIVTSTLIAPLLATVRRRVGALAITTLLAVCFVALLLSYSRSAWLGAGVGTLITLVLFHRPLITLWNARRILRVPPFRLALGIGSVALAGLMLFILIDGPGVVAFTLSGHEASAAGRGASLARGMEVTISNPGGLSLGSAGPTALARTGRAVLTENWYLLYGIQLGVISAGILVSLLAIAVLRTYWAAAALVASLSRPVMPEAPCYPMWVALGAMTALIGALVGAFVIPALLDLPASLTLWAVVAMVIGWTLPNRSRRPEATSVEAEPA